MTDTARPVAAMDVSVRARPSHYPAPFADMVAGREKRALGDVFGLTKFGVNLTILSPGARSALLHRHSHQQEFIYILSGTPTLRTDAEEYAMQPGMCVGFMPGGDAHQLVNRSDAEVVYLEIGDRDPDDSGFYPEDDLRAERDGEGWRFLHKDGRAY